jgi:hypothetical protein
MNYDVKSPELVFLYASASTSGSGKPELHFVKNTTIVVLT